MTTLKRLQVLVEGQTEEMFVKQALAPYLAGRGFIAVVPKLVGNARSRGRRGGVKPWSSARADILTFLREDHGIFVSTMIDYYGMPSGESGWPGRSLASSRLFPERQAYVEAAMEADIQEEFAAAGRFVPYVVMHEFEGLLFSDPDSLSRALGGSLTDDFAEVRSKFESPEEINDSESTAPSKRIAAIFPRYQKVFDGSRAVREVGIEVIRMHCAGFNRWIERLEAL